MQAQLQRPSRIPFFLHVKPGDAVVTSPTRMVLGVWQMRSGWMAVPETQRFQRCSKWLMSIPASSTGSTLTWLRTSFRAAESGRRGRGNPLVFISQGAAVVQTRDSFLKRLNDGSHWELMPNWFLDRFAGLHRQVAREPKWVMRQWCL